jgi:hypothetical protein
MRLHGGEQAVISRGRIRPIDPLGIVPEAEPGQPDITYEPVRIPWKLLGLAGLAGVAATGVLVARRRRAHREYDPQELRERLHRRLAEVSGEAGGAGESSGPG